MFLVIKHWNNLIIFRLSSGPSCFLLNLILIVAPSDRSGTFLTTKNPYWFSLPCAYGNFPVLERKHFMAKTVSMWCDKEWHWWSILKCLFYSCVCNGNTNNIMTSLLVEQSSKFMFTMLQCFSIQQKVLSLIFPTE